VGYLELGNELYGGGTTSDYVKVYPTAEDYVKTVNSWIKAIKRLYPDIKIAAVAVNRAIELERHVHDEREDTWNKALMSALVGADAVVLHNYPAARLPTHTFVTDDNAETMLQEPLINWDQIVADDLPELINKTTGYTPDIWFTEYNLKEDSDVQAEGSWAQGLYVATLSLLYATNSRVQMAVNYNVYDGMYADIFAVSDLFQLRDKLNITAAVNGYTAKGLTTREVDAAAMGKTCAAALTFPGGPTFDGTHPKLIGEVFSGDESGTSTAPATPDKRCSASSLPSLLAKSDSQIIILNLDSVAHAVRFGDLLSRGAYQQIHGSAGSYVDGKVLPHGFEGFASDLSHADLTLTAEVLNPRYLWLAPFSITRVVTGADAPSPGSGDLPQ
jgi:hypothetical protein